MEGKTGQKILHKYGVVTKCSYEKLQVRTCFPCICASVCIVLVNYPLDPARIGIVERRPSFVNKMCSP